MVGQLTQPLPLLVPPELHMQPSVLLYQTKEQLKALKAQKARAAAEAEQAAKETIERQRKHEVCMNLRSKLSFRSWHQEAQAMHTMHVLSKE